jgi:hypothetical protein
MTRGFRCGMALVNLTVHLQQPFPRMILENLGLVHVAPPILSTSARRLRNGRNLNVRMHTRRFTRLTSAFSKKVENHTHSVALFAMNYILFASIRRCGPRRQWRPM